jgi:hypothetical protein
LWGKKFSNEKKQYYTFSHFFIRARKGKTPMGTKKGERFYKVCFFGEAATTTALSP